MKVVRIEWGDAQHQESDSWIAIDDMLEELRPIFTVGHLVSENDVRYSIAHTYDPGNEHVSGVLHIPKACVTKIVEL